MIDTPTILRNIFELTKVLPAGMAFPYHFGFVQSTRGGDGDPLDVPVLMDKPAFSGCKLTCVVGIIEGEQSDGESKRRNDRVVAVEIENHSYARAKQVDDLGRRFEKELEAFLSITAG